MANKTDVAAYHTHGTDPQYLIEKITREKIYDSNYCTNSSDSAAAADGRISPAQRRQAPSLSHRTAHVVSRSCLLMCALVGKEKCFGLSAATLGQCRSAEPRG